MIKLWTAAVYLHILCAALNINAQNYYSFGSSLYTVEEGGELTINVLRTTTDFSQQTVLVILDWADDDFIGTSQVAVFQPTDLETSVTFATVNDDIPEPLESFPLTLQSTSPSVLLGSLSSAEVDIPANDNAYGIFSFQNLMGETVNEGQTFTINVTRLAGAYGTVDINYMITGSVSEMAAFDITPSSGTIQFSADERLKKITLTAVNDSVPENDEVFVIKLFTPSTGAAVTNGGKQITIRKNDVPIRFLQDHMYTSENKTQVTLPIQITRGYTNNGETIVGPLDSDVTVSYYVTSRSAISGVDFLLDDGILLFGAGETRNTINALILSDDIPELEEEFVVELRAVLTGDAVIVTPSTLTVTITANDDQHGVVSFNPMMEFPVYVNEDLPDTIILVSLVRQAGLYGQVNVTYSLTSSTSGLDAGTDILPSSGLVSFEDNVSTASFNLTILKDDIPEVSESFVLTLTAVAGGARFDSSLSRVIIIQDSDAAHGAVQWKNGSHQIVASSQARYIIWTIERKGGAIDDVVVTFACSYMLNGVVVADTLMSNRPYQVIIPNGQSEATVSVEIRDSAFLDMVGEFWVTIDEVKLLNEPSIPSFNSPFQGAAKTDKIRVTAAAANGEVGITDLTTRVAYEPDSGVSQVSVTISREGLSGTATVSWSVTGTQHSPITADDIINSAGQVIMLNGERSKEIVIEIKADDISETDEGMILALLSVSPNDTQKLRAGYTQVEIRIAENDNPGGVFQFKTIDPLIKTEGDVFMVEVERLGGDLVSRSLYYSILPDARDEFYGSTGIITFTAGQKSKSISLIVANDDKPELNETYQLTLRGHGNPQAVIGNNTAIDITILENDVPYGEISFLDGMRYHVFESKAGNISSAQVLLIRNRGTYGQVSVSWRVRTPNAQTDISPSDGEVTFAPGESIAFLTISTLEDSYPEEEELFVLELHSPTNGSVLGGITTTEIIVIKNDIAVYFKETSPAIIAEGGHVQLTVQRTDSTKPAAVSYRTRNGTASVSDYVEVQGRIEFPPGLSNQHINLTAYQDTIPEADEMFYVELFDPEGDIVLYNMTEASVIISANDDASGIFRFGGPYHLSVEEGDRFGISIIRDRGLFGTVNVSWHILANNSDLPDGEEYQKTTGHVIFTDGEIEKEIEITVLTDGIPEYDETYEIVLYSVTGGLPGEGLAGLSSLITRISIIILTNDDPNGLLLFSPRSRELMVTEDILIDSSNQTQAMFEVLREKGSFGDIEVMWEMYSSQTAGVMPKMNDLLFTSIIGEAVSVTESGGRNETKTPVYHFSGQTVESYARVPPNLQDWISSDFAISIWIKPEPGCNGYIMYKSAYSEDSHKILYSLRVTADTLGSPVSVSLAMLDHMSQIVKTETALWRASGGRHSDWQHILINMEKGLAEFVFNGALSAQKSFPSVRIDIEGPLYIGSNTQGSDMYTGSIQDLRVYNRKLTPAEVMEIVTYPSKQDVTPTSGLLRFLEGEVVNSFIVQSVQDVEAESNEVFTVKLIASRGGASISEVDSLAKLTVLKSDNANGLFGFEGTCQPFSSAEEGVVFSCTVKRDRGDAGTVTIYWRLEQLFNNNTSSPNIEDFTTRDGLLVFTAGQLRQEITVSSIQDMLPEEDESFQLVLYKAEAWDGNGPTPTSGASINPDAAAANITLYASDLPYGLLQFSKRAVVDESVGIIPPAESQPEIRVSESSGSIYLLVERAQGLLGHVMIEWRTEDAVAHSEGVNDPDFMSSVGSLQFQEGQRYAFINITILDDSLAEDDEYFYVHLVNPVGGVSLGVGSTVKVTIVNSDDAFGVIEFNSIALSTVVSESQIGSSNVTLAVMRYGGLIGATEVTWRILNDADGDFLYNTGSVRFLEGQQQADLVVTVLADEVPELDESFTIQLVNTTQGRLGNEDFLKSTVSILANDDPYGLFVFEQSSRRIECNEGTAVTLTVTRKQGTDGVVNINYYTASPADESTRFPPGVSRASLSDYVYTNGTLTFLKGDRNKTITITINDDNLPETEEYLFVLLSLVSLVSGGQGRPLADSPRLGPITDAFSQIIIRSNDNANGVLQLSTLAVSVREDQMLPFLFVNRSAGNYGEVTVRFEVVAGNATPSVDYYFTSNNVILSEHETSKQLPIFIINDHFPELSETFTVHLLPYTTGGAVLGNLTECLVTIQPSDDPQGAFEFSVPGMTVTEPQTGEKQVDIHVIRLGGTMQIVAVQWTATDEDGELSHDIEPSYGTIYFTSNQASQVITVRVQSDAVPEPSQRINVNLTQATNGGRIGLNHIFILTIAANDNPHGTVEFISDTYELVEEEQLSLQQISIQRLGGAFGNLKVYYSTSMIDLLTLAAEMIPSGGNSLWFYQDPIAKRSNITGNILDRANQANPLVACSEYCVLQKSCTGFDFDQQTLMCQWFSDVIHDSSLNSAEGVVLYRKATSRVSNLYNSQAEAGSDYQTVTSSFVMILDGSSTASISQVILPDSYPELNEKYSVLINKVELVSEEAVDVANLPTLGARTSTTCVIRYNDDANGVFRIYSRDPRATNNGQTIMVEERDQFALELVVERTGGSIGDVAVAWSVHTKLTNASRETDYIADGATLTFPSGDAVRVITVGIQDDSLPELNEVVVIQLTNPQGGALLGPNQHVNIVISANDHVAGILGFQMSSYIAKEGDSIDINVTRSLPAYGQVQVQWLITGLNGHVALQGFTETSGLLNFSEGIESIMFTVSVVDDGIPEVNEEYTIELLNITTIGIPISGSASLDKQRSVASITVQASNDPHGVFSLAITSLNLQTEEGSPEPPHLIVDRKFGAIGAVKVFYSVISGHLQPLTEELHEAEQGVDFIGGDHYYITIGDGSSSGRITLNITDDSTPEVQEVFLLTLTGVELITPGESSFQPRLSTQNIQTEVFIAANDGTRGQIQFPADSLFLFVSEDTTLLQISVRRAYGAYGRVSVFIYSQSYDDAVLGQDYLFNATELVFESGESIKTVNVTILDDEIPEPSEVFELVLASPQGGAAIGSQNVMKIAIEENDGAGGVVEFVSDLAILLAEPEQNSNEVASSVDIELMRGPGSFGTVTVSFKVADSNGDLTTDITPSHGEVNFGDQQKRANIRLSVVDDDIPEELETLTLSLSAEYSTLLGKKTVRTLKVSRSDSPNGLLHIVLSTNSSILEATESNRTVTCDIYRTKGLQGQVNVDVETTSITAQALPGPKLYTAEFQTFTRSSSGYCSFGKYLIILNSWSLMEFTSSIGSDGESSTLPSQHQSQLLVWDGKYKHISYLETNNAVKCLSFMQSKQRYLVIVNRGAPGSTSQTSSRLYTVDESNHKVKVLQNLVTHGAVDGAVYHLNQQTFLALLNVADISSTSDSSLQLMKLVNNSLVSVVKFPLASGKSLDILEPLVATMTITAAIVQQSNIKIFTVNETSWTLQQTLDVLGGTDVAISNSKQIMAISHTNGYSIYRVDPDLVTLVHSRELSQASSISIYEDEKTTPLIAVTSSYKSVICSWNGTVIDVLYEMLGTPSVQLLSTLADNKNRAMLAVPGDERGILQRVALLQSNADYLPRSATLTFTEGEVHKSLDFVLFDDSLPEATESFSISLSQPAGGAELDPEHTSVIIYILSNDNANGIIQFSEDSLNVMVEENLADYVLQLYLVRSAGLFGRVFIAWAATANQSLVNDINPTSGQVEFLEGQSVAQLSITIRADKEAENEEKITLSLIEVLNTDSQLPQTTGIIGSASRAMLTILANESPHGVIRWERQSVVIAEPDSSDNTVQLTIIREQGTAGAISLTYITSRDTASPSSSQAVSGQDYVSKQDTVLLAENQTRASVEIIIKADDLPETEEHFFVNITSVRLISSGQSVLQPSIRSPAHIIVVIAENDNARGVIQFDVQRNNEGRIDVYESYKLDTLVSLKLTRTLGYFGSVNITWVILPREISAADVSVTQGSVIFYEGQKEAFIEFKIIDDEQPEPMEMFDVQLVSVTGGAALGTSRIVRIAILKNDSPNGLFGFSSTQYAVRETANEYDPARSTTLEVTRTQGTQGVVNLYWQLDANAANDLEPPLSGSLRFDVGETSKNITLKARNDGLLEGEERFTISLTSADNNADLSVTSRDAVVIIMPDDGSYGHIEVVKDYRQLVIAEPSALYSGRQAILLTRGTGIYGELIVSWSILPFNPIGFVMTEGEVAFLDGQQTVEVFIQTKDNIQPEERKLYTFRILSVTGGATVSEDTSRAIITYAASDYPFGEFEFDTSDPTTVTEDSSQISLSIVRNKGVIGNIRVNYTTSQGSATRNEDYVETAGSIMFSSGQSRQVVLIKLLQDDIPEGPETFYVNITSVRMEPAVVGLNFSSINGIQLDLPPIIGQSNVKPITISKNDNAEGVIQFHSSSGSVTVQESDRVAYLKLTRSSGAYGEVSVTFNVMSGSAINYEDFFLESGELFFPDGVSEGHINVTIIDDAFKEMPEYFQVTLLSTRGGALLGPRSTSLVTIDKSDYPNGKFSFVGSPHRNLANPDNAFTIDLILRRSEGSAGTQILLWRILGPNSALPLEATSDVAIVSESGLEITEGQLIWSDGEVGDKTLVLLVKPHSGWEIEKTFRVEIIGIQNDVNPLDDGQVDPQASYVTVVVQKNGDPNGIVQFSTVSLVHQTYIEPNSEKQEVSLFVERLEGNLGDQEVFWEVSGGNGDVDDDNDVEPGYGSVVMKAGVSVVPIRLYILHDDIPELNENFTVRLTYVQGGATLLSNLSVTSFTIRYNDDPHGVFNLHEADQKILVNPVTFQRSIHCMVNRSAGLLGSVRVSVGVAFSQLETSFPTSRSLLVESGQKSASTIIDITDDVFIGMDSYFTLALSDVTYTGGAPLTSDPRIGSNSNIRLSVPEMAANSYVAMTNSTVPVNETTQVAYLSVTRIGLYGNLQIPWRSGYPPGQLPAGFDTGFLAPSTGSLFLPHGIRSVFLSVSLITPVLSDSDLYAVYLSSNPVTSVKGGAKLTKDTDQIYTELEPCGVFKFSSPIVEVHESQQTVRITIERLYGSRRNVQLKYSTRSDTALAVNDFTLIDGNQVVFSEKQKTINIEVPIALDSLAEQDEVFLVTIDSVEVLPTTQLTMISPRLSSAQSECQVIIKANGDPYGLLDIVAKSSRVTEVNQNEVILFVRRNAGSYGHVTVRVRSVGGGESWDEQIALIPRTDNNDTISQAMSNRDTRQTASAASDYMIVNEVIQFEQDEVEKEIRLTILDDEIPESDEMVLIYLTEATGGARIAEGTTDGMKYGYTTVNIIKNDDWNGLIGFSDDSRNVTIDEDGNRKVQLTLIRSSHAEFTYDTTIQWEAIYSVEDKSYDLVESSGIVTCFSLQSTCALHLVITDDNIPEFGYSFMIRLFNPSVGSKVNNQKSHATVWVLPSDSPYGKIEMRKEYIVVGHTASAVQIPVDRKLGINYRVSVSFTTERIFDNDIIVAGVKVNPAVNGVDFNRASGTITFEDGKDSENVDITLIPNQYSTSNYPKVFKVIISNPQFGAVLGSRTECNVIIVNSENSILWGTQVDASTQLLTDSNIDYLLDTLLSTDCMQLDPEAVIVMENVLSQIIEEGKTRSLAVSAREKLTSIFCLLMNPNCDVAKGRFSLAKLFEDFIFTLLVGEPCESEIIPYNKISCQHFSFGVAKLLSYNLNRYQYTTSKKDYLRVGPDIAATDDNKTCILAQFIDYNNDHWFNKYDGRDILNNRMLSLNLRVEDGSRYPRSKSVDSAVIYRIYTANGRRTDKRAQCVFFDENSLQWTTGSNACIVKNELQLGTSDFVECECSHLSTYAVTSQTRSKAEIGYPTYMFIIAGICLFCLLLALLVFLIFPSTGQFTVKLVMHTLFCSFLTLGIYLLSAYLSPDTSPEQILVKYTDNESNYRCIIVGVILHYFLLAQFLWILLQSINIWLIFTKNDEHTERLHCWYITIGYGLAALFVGGFYGVTYYLYLQHNLNPNFIYGDVKNEGEICFLTNQYAALSGVLAPVIVCAVGVLIFVGEISCRSKQWKSYDDIFKERPNFGEIWSIILLWFLILLTNMTGGLHMAYNHNWMMITFCVCLALTAVFVVSYFAILRGPCADCSTKSKSLAKSQEGYQSALIVNTDKKDEAMLQIPQIVYPSPNTANTFNKNRELLVKTTDRYQPSWEHDSKDGILNSSMIKRSDIDGASLSRRSVLPNDGDTRDLGELILALKADRPGTSTGAYGHHNSIYTDDETDDTSTHQGAYDVLRRISVADTHL